MNILLLNYEYPPIGGGGGVISQHIATGLAKLHKVTVLTIWFSGLSEDESNSNLRIVRVKSKRKNTFRSGPFEMLSWIRHSKRALNELCKTVEFDVCFANFVMPGGEVALYLKREFGIPFVLLSHGHDIPWVKPYGALLPLHALSYFRLKRICRNSERIFVQTALMKANADKFVGAHGAHKVRIIPNGCGTSDINLSQRSKSKLKLLFVGRLVKQKGPMIFLRALAEFSRFTDNFEVTVCGDGPLRGKMERYVLKSGLDSKVNFLGKIPQEEVVEAYSNSHVMIAPSISEGMSISMLEALSMGVYLISTNVSGVDDIVEQKLNGDIVADNDPHAISSKLRLFYIEKMQKNYSISTSFLKEFRDEFSWDKIVHTYDKELQEVIPARAEPLKVLHVIDTLGLGGAQTLLRSIMFSGNDDVQSRVFALRNVGMQTMPEDERIKIYKSGSRFSFLPLLFLHREIRKHGISVLHCHLPRSIVFGFIIKRFFLPELKLVVHEHGDIYENGKLLPILLRSFSSGVNKFLACSAASKQKLIQRAGIESDKIEVLHNCWEVSKTSKTGDYSGKSSDVFTIGFAGRLVQRKGWLDFLQVAHHLVNRDSALPVRFVMAGSGPDEEMVRDKIKELNLGDRVSMLGYVDNMSAFYSEINCCVIPSEWEGLPLVQLEAMASGVPIITYDAPGLNEITTHEQDALVVPLGNVKAVAEQIVRLFGDIQLAENLRTRGLQTVKRHDSKTYNQALGSLYRNLG